MATRKSGWNRSIVPVSALEPESIALAVSEDTPSANFSAASNGDCIIPRGMVVQGEITGCGSLLVEGSVRGTIRLDGARVTVGRDGNVEASIVAGDVLVMGQVRGDICATKRAEISAGGALNGKVVSPRLIVGLGASLKSDIETRTPEPTSDLRSKRSAPAPGNLEAIQRMPAAAFHPVGVKSVKEIGFDRERLSAG